MGKSPTSPTGGTDPGLLNDARLFAEVASVGRLLGAWQRVRDNAGASGGDGVTVRAFEMDAPRRIARLSERLTGGDYAPGPIRKVEIPKPSGGVRGLSIPCVVDRIAQTAAQMVLSPLLDQTFDEASFAYRPGRGVDDAVRRVDALRREGFMWLLDADIEGFFDNVQHDRLMGRLAQSLTAGPLTQLIELWLTHAAPTGRGLPQGSPVSPLLANLYLDQADDALAGRGLRLVRFADDFLILTRDRGGAEAARERAVRVLADLGLKLKAEKTRVVSFDQGFRFLGHLFVRSLVLESGPVDTDTAEVDRALAALARGDVAAEDSSARAEAVEETRRAAGLTAAFRVLYVRSPDRRVALRNTAFSIQAGHGFGAAVDWREILAIPHQAVDRVEVWPDGAITDEALRHAIHQGVEVAFVNGHGETIGVAGARRDGRAGRHLDQAAASLDPVRRLDLAARIVEGRLRNQRAVISRLNRRRSDGEATKAQAELGALIRKVPHAESVAQAMGFEGRGAALYWPALGRCLEHSWWLKSRDRKPAPDPVNLTLNFTAWLLARDIGVAVVRAGLHPGFGVLHSVEDDKDACVYDLMEEFRAPLSESLTVYAFNNRILRQEHFRSPSGDGVRIERAGADALIRAYEAAAERVVRHPVSGRRGSWRAMMTEQAFAYAAHVEGRAPYQPMTMDY